MLIEGTAGLERNGAPLCVVGSGPVGLSLAVDLARRGIDVLLLESGTRAAHAEVQALSDADIADPARHDDMAIAVARRLGGTSHLWGGRCLPYDPVDFAPRGWVDARWPITHAALTPYWPRAVAATTSGAAVFTAGEALWPEADREFGVDSLERWANVQSSAAVFRAEIEGNPHLEVRTLATLVGLDFSDNGAVIALEVAHSLSGQRVRVPVRRLVLAAGGVETARLLLHAAGESDRFGAREGALGRYYMGHLVGEIADLAFDRPGGDRAFDFDVDQHGSYARRRFVAGMETQLSHGLLNAAFWPVVPPVAAPAHGSAILSLVYLALRHRVLGEKLVAEAIRRRHIPEPPGPVMPHVANLLSGLPASLAFGASFLRRRYGGRHRLPGFFLLNRARRYGLAYHGEQRPERNSAVRLTQERDRLGLPRLAIDLRFGEGDAQSLVDSHELLDGWLRRNKIGRLHYRMAEGGRRDAILAGAAHGTHQIGLARMGVHRRDAVVDQDLRAFDAPNLHLAGAAVLPTSGQANPTLTAVALALRLADHIAAAIATD